MKQTLSKFFVLWTMIFMISIIFFFASVIVGAFDEYATISQKMNYSGSILIGNVLIILIVSSIIVIFALHLPMKIVLLLAFSVAAVLPVISLIMTTTMRAGITKENVFQSYVRAPISTSTIAKTGKAKISSNDNDIIYVMNKEATPKAYNILHQTKSDPYEKLAYIDIWEQFQGLYSLTYSNIYNSLSAKKWTEKKYKYHVSSSDATITFGKNKFGILFQKNIIINNGLFLKQENLNQLGLPNSLLLRMYQDLIKDPKYHFESSSFIKQLIYIQRVSEEFTKPLVGPVGTLASINPILTTTDKSMAQQFKNIETIHFLMWSYLQESGLFSKPSTFGFASDEYTKFGNVASASFNVTFVKDGETFGTVEPGSYVNKTFLYVFWFLLAFLLISGTIFTAYKKDYK